MLICSILFAQKIHVVKKGDTLWDLSGYYYDNPFIWRNIYNANLDKIDDPHWIYPGQEFIIPDMPEDAVYTETEEVYEDVQDEADMNTDERAPADLMVTKEEGSLISTYTQISEDETVTQIQKIREDIKKIEKSKTMNISNTAGFAVAEKLAFRAGYITPENPYVGKLGELMQGFVLYSRNEMAYIKLTDENNADIMGKELIIYRWENSVSNNNGEYLGKHVNILGTIKVEGIDGDLAYGTVTGAYDMIKKNDFVALYTPSIIPINNAYLRELSDIRATLIGQADKTMRINEYSIVFIDIGKESMVNHGDVFTIIRKNKSGEYYAAGALQVLVPYNGYSTAYMLSIKGNVDIKAKEEIKLSFRNKSSYLINQYKNLSQMQGQNEIITEESVITEEIMEEPIIEEMNEEITMEEETVIMEEPIIEEVTEEIIMEEETVIMEEPIMTEETPGEIVVEEMDEQPVIMEEETAEIITEEYVEEPITEEEPMLMEEDFVIEESAVVDTNDGFIIEETPSDSVYEDIFIIEGEDEIIIIEE